MSASGLASLAEFAFEPGAGAKQAGCEGIDEEVSGEGATPEQEWAEHVGPVGETHENGPTEATRQRRSGADEDP